MFGTIRKHQTWLWVVIITLTVISFVWFFSPSQGGGQGGGGGGYYGSIAGDKISALDFRNAQREVALHHFLTTGRWPDEDMRSGGFDPERETYQWLLLVHKIEQMKVRVGPEEVARIARERIRPFERMGITSPAMFVQQVLRPHGLTLDDFERFARHSLGIQELINTVGLPGTLVTPAEADALYQREHQQLATEAVFFSASNYLASVTANPEAVAQFYSNRLAAYRIPERLQLTYVEFPFSNYLSQAETELSKTNLSEVVEANYVRLGTNYFAGSTPEQAKAKIREQIIEQKARTLARERANEFARPIFDMEPMRADNLEKQAQAAGLAVHVTAPFDRENGPEEIDAGPDFTKAAFRLNSEEPFASPAMGEHGMFVVAYHRTIPSEIPPLDQIRAKVASDYQQTQAIQMARHAADTFVASATNALAQGKSFPTIAAEAKAAVTQIPPLAISTRAVPELEEQVQLNQYKQIAFSTQPGKLSQATPIPEGAVAVYVKEKLPLDQAAMKADLPDFLTRVRRARQEEAFNAWFRKEAERALRDTPLNRPPPPTMGAGTAKS